MAAWTNGLDELERSDTVNFGPDIAEWGETEADSRICEDN